MITDRSVLPLITERSICRYIYIYIYIYRFIITLGRNFLVFLSMVLSPYASKRARVYAVTASIFYFLLVAVALCGASLPFLVGCRRPRQSAGHGGECAVEADVLPLPPRIVAYAASLWFSLSVFRLALIRSLAARIAPFLAFFVLVVHVELYACNYTHVANFVV